jgi:hypothetical protein
MACADKRALGDDSGLALSDLAPYRAALEGKPSEAAIRVGFRDLWVDPERYKGHRVAVEGNVARRFRQAAYGTFPPLIELWATSQAGDPFCLVYPDSGTGAGRAEPPLGSTVHFEGTFLRSLRYQGADTARLAPLIVGERGPVLVSPPPRSGRTEVLRPFQGERLWLDTVLAVLAGVVVWMVLARQHLRRPIRPRNGLDPPPEFLDGT